MTANIKQRKSRAGNPFISETRFQVISVLSVSELMDILNERLLVVHLAVSGYTSSAGDAFSFLSQRCKPAVCFLPNSEYLVLTQLQGLIKRSSSLFLPTYCAVVYEQHCGSLQSLLTSQMNRSYFVRFNTIIKQLCICVLCSLQLFSLTITQCCESSKSNVREVD